MSFRQHSGDAYWLAAAAASEARRRWRGGRARARPRFNATAARRDCRPQRPNLVMHLKVPKAASTTVFDLVTALAAKNGYAVNSRPMYVRRSQNLSLKPPISLRSALFGLIL